MNPSAKVLLIGTPVYEGKVSARYARSVLAFQAACEGRKDILFEGVAQWGDSLITRAKQGLLSRLLGHPTATHLLLVDGDIAFTSDQVFQLLGSGVEMAGWGSGAPERTEFTQVPSIPSSFLLVQKTALAAMTERYPELKYRNELSQAGDLPLSLWNYALFNCMIDPRTQAFLDGDQSFCKRWTDMGGKIWGA